MDPLIHLDQGAFGYGESNVFADLSLDLHRGSVFCLLGPNGCGKTTLLRCIGGAQSLRKGRVTLCGKDMRSIGETERARTLGFVFQEHHVLFPYTVLDVVKMGRAPYLGLFEVPGTHDTEVAETALDTVGIRHLRLKRYTEISGGERQLALIARALAQEPQVLLLDEPTSHLDFGNQLLVLETIWRLARERGLAVLMATHVPDHALLIATVVALMKNGQFLAQGRPEEVLSEANLSALYGINVRVVNVTDAEGQTLSRAAVGLLGKSEKRATEEEPQGPVQRSKV